MYHPLLPVSNLTNIDTEKKTYNCFNISCVKDLTHNVICPPFFSLHFKSSFLWTKETLIKNCWPLLKMDLKLSFRS